MATVFFSFTAADKRPLAGLVITVVRGAEAVFRGETDQAGGVTITLGAELKDGVVVVVATDPVAKREVYRSEPTPVGELPAKSAIVVKESGSLPTRPRPRTSLAAAVADRISREREIGEAVRAASRQEIARRLRVRDAGAALGRRVLGGKPLRNLGAGNLFVGRGEELGPVLQRSRVAGLARLQALHANRRGILVRAGDLGLDNPRPGTVIDAARAGRLAGRALGAVPAGSVVDAILRRCAARARAAAERNLAEGSEPVAPVPGPVEPPGELTPAQRVAAILDRDYLGETTGRPTFQAVDASLRSEVPLGPADADAYYDYHAVQVAWSDVWTAVVDGISDRAVKELYESIVEVVDPEDLPADLSEVDELHDMLEMLADSVAAASSTLSAPSEIAAWEPVVGQAWSSLSFGDQEYVRFLWVADGFVSSLRDSVRESAYRDEYLDAFDEFEDYPESYIPSRTLGALIDDEEFFRREARGVARDVAASTAAGAAAARLGRAERLITELKAQLVAPYQFDVFAEGSYNFGVLATYRQRWRPLGYQAGDLAGAMALAPNEKRSYSVTRKSTRKVTRGSEIERMSGGTSETGETSRAEADIVRAAKVARSAQVSYSPKVDVAGIGGLEAGSAQFGATQDDSSSQTKKDIREATRKAAQEYRDQHKVTMGFEETYETSFTSKRDIENPNNELTITYLFYELQRRYEVCERLHDLTPVILVAYDMPAPHEITEAWLLKHDWIIREALLDRSFRPALRYLSQTFAGDEVAVEVLEEQWRTQLAVVAELRRHGRAHAELRDEARKAMEHAVAAVTDVQSGLSPSDLEVALGPAIGGWLADRLFGDDEPEAEASAENAQRALAWADADLAQVNAAVRENLTVLERATSAYVQGVRRRLDRRVQIDRLILHVKENILHYMQAIWDREHPDQRYLRLYDREIQWPGPTGEAVLRDVAVRLPRSAAADDGPTFDVSPRLPDGLTDRSLESQPVGTLLFGTPTLREQRTLHQVADLRKPLGYRGNFAIFPLREHNALSTYLAQDFLDTQFGVRDPDPLGTVPTASEAITLARCAWRHGDLDEAGKAEIAEWLMDALDAAHRVSQEIVLPTGELFIEALPGAHPLLEDFKLRHRAYDAERARADAVTAHIEALRRALRLQQGDVSDPDVDRYVRIEGGAVPTVPIDNG